MASSVGSTAVVSSVEAWVAVSRAGSWSMASRTGLATGLGFAISGRLGVALENSSVTDDVLFKAREEDDSSLEIN